MTIGVHRCGQNCLLNHDHLFLMTCGSFDFGLDFDERYKCCTPTRPNPGCYTSEDKGEHSMFQGQREICALTFSAVLY